MNPLFSSLLVIVGILSFAVTARSEPVIIGDERPATIPGAKAVPGVGTANFPENAITRVGENTGGQVDAPVNPPSPAAPASPAAAAAAPTPATPASPPAPVSPASKLWPKNTVEIFVPPCTGLRPAYVKPCVCVITQLMVQMPHDEFLKKSEDGTIEQDPRLLKIRTDCATAPQKKG